MNDRVPTPLKLREIHTFSTRQMNLSRPPFKSINSSSLQCSHGVKNFFLFLLHSKFLILCCTRVAFRYRCFASHHGCAVHLNRLRIASSQSYVAVPLVLVAVADGDLTNSEPLSSPPTTATFVAPLSLPDFLVKACVH
ncbi:hypothetical protein RIF29_38932 [Crotalaria pallida]|uniref:Uncharacterized protein n=1 Tax=Crotalaria pallida TaxID=3830 RepID=A0AAN9E075_CROPI